MNETINYRGHNITIAQEEDTENPYTEMDQLSDVVTWMRSYEFSSDGAWLCGSAAQARKMPNPHKLYDEPAEVIAALKSGELVYAAPLYAYIHSGITVNLGSMGNWPDQEWDCGLAGFVFVTREKARKEFPKLFDKNGRPRNKAKIVEECARVAENEVQVLDQWLTGDVWYYSITPDEETQDGCEDSISWIYGYDCALQEAKNTIDCYLDKARRQLTLPGSARELAELVI